MLAAPSWEARHLRDLWRSDFKWAVGPSSSSAWDVYGLEECIRYTQLPNRYSRRFFFFPSLSITRWYFATFFVLGYAARTALWLGSRQRATKKIRKEKEKCFYAKFLVATVSAALARLLHETRPRVSYKLRGILLVFVWLCYAELAGESVCVVYF